MKIEELDIEKAKEIIIEWAKNKPFVTKVSLFGSRVTGISQKTGKPARPDSDLDVALEFSQVNDDEDLFTTWISEAKHWHQELSTLLGFSNDEDLDLGWHHYEETPHITQYLEKNSVIIYSADEI